MPRVAIVISVLSLASVGHAQAPEPVLSHEPEAHAESEAEAEDADSEEVGTPPASPTEVSVGLHVRALAHVDPPSESFPHFRAQIVLRQRWRDPRLATGRGASGRARLYHGAAVARELRRIWNPDLSIENEDGDRQSDGRTLAIRHDGTVILEEAFASEFRARMNLERFPFDDQRFHFGVQSMSWNANKVRLVIDEERSGFRGGNQRGSLEWTIEGLTHQAREANAPHSSHPYSRAVFSIEAQRAFGFYLWKLVVPLLLIVFFTWSTFWMTGEPAGTRLQRTFIALLSVVAFHHVVAEHLPPIPDLTFMDSIVYLAFAFTGLTMVQIIATHRAVVHEDAARAARLDRVSRWLFPVSFAAGLGVLWIVYS